MSVLWIIGFAFWVFFFRVRTQNTKVSDLMFVQCVRQTMFLCSDNSPSLKIEESSFEYFIFGKVSRAMACIRMRRNHADNNVSFKYHFVLLLCGGGAAAVAEAIADCLWGVARKRRLAKRGATRNREKGTPPPNKNTI